MDNEPNDTRTEGRGEEHGRGRHSRRRFLQATAAAGAVAAGLGSSVVGTGRAAGIPTPRLTREGNQMLDPEGNEVVLRGVNVVDPARAVETAWRRSNSKTVEHATDESRGWYSRVIRLPIQPGDVAEFGKGHGQEPLPGAFDRSKLETYLTEYVDPVVETCAQRGAYCILDYHRHQDHDLKYTNSALDDEVQMFWETVAPRYAEDSHVLYEVYNEPISPFVGFRERNVNVDIRDPEAEETWLTWRDAAQPWVDTIREHAPQNPILIGSPSWSQWTYWADKREFEGDNLAYVGHVYAHPNLRPLGDYFGEPARNVPVFMTEFGWQPDGNKYFQGTTTTEGEQFREFFEEYDSVHWTVWCFDHIWAPAMFDKNDDTKEWELRSGEKYHGEFFRAYLEEKRSADVPAGEGPTTEGPSTPTDATETSTDVAEGPPALGDAAGAPTDPDDDGKYEDLTGNGEADPADVVSLFEHKNDPVVADYPEYYDFSGNGGVEVADVVQLFQEL